MNRSAIAFAGFLLILGGAAHAQDAPSRETVTAMQAEIAALRAREDIRELLHAYGRTLDARDFDAFAQLWTDDAEYLGGGNTAPVIGGPAIAEFLENIFAANPSGFGEPSAHIFFNESIAVTGASATGTSMSGFVTTAEDGPQLSILARYEDEYALEDGRWKFARRAVRGLGPAPTPAD